MGTHVWGVQDAPRQPLLLHQRPQPADDHEHDRQRAHGAPDLGLERRLRLHSVDGVLGGPQVHCRGTPCTCATEAGCQTLGFIK